MAQFADIWYTANGANYGRNQHYNDSRYHMLNYHATFTKGTIEFRLFQFDKPTAEKKNGLHAGQLKSYIQLCLALSEMAKGLRTASPKPQQTENPKFAMRTWLIRLGLVGEEFATARNFLTKNLPVRQIKGQPFATSYTRPLRRSYGGERVSLSERI